MTARGLWQQGWFRYCAVGISDFAVVRGRAFGLPVYRRCAFDFARLEPLLVCLRDHAPEGDPEGEWLFAFSGSVSRLGFGMTLTRMTDVRAVRRAPGFFGIVL